MTIEEARAYVGTTPKSGAAQLVLLLDEGLWPSHRVLEYGCGTLHLGRLLIAHQWVRRYYGMDPNAWLVDAALGDDPSLRQAVNTKGARFSTRDDFDAASTFRTTFDYIFAHSVLSHASTAQLDQFLKRSAEVLRPDGKILASLRLGDDTNADEWTYPGVTFFSPRSISAAAERAKLRVRFAGEHRQIYSAICTDEIHDWIVLEHAR